MFGGAGRGEGKEEWGKGRESEGGEIDCLQKLKLEDDLLEDGRKSALCVVVSVGGTKRGGAHGYQLSKPPSAGWKRRKKTRAKSTIDSSFSRFVSRSTAL